jgi:hypothetical protein
VFALALVAVLSASCGDSTTSTPAPVLTTINVTLSSPNVVVGQKITATAAGVDQNGAPITAGTVTWSSSSTSVATVGDSASITAVAAGTAQIIATVGTLTGQATVTVAAPAGIKINEVESNGGTPGDWVELYNPTTATVDMSGWILKDNDDTHTYAFPASTTIAAGGYFVAEEANFVFGLGAPDAARLYNQFGAPVDSYSWTTHASTTYARCPNGTGDFTTATSSTKGAANDCSVAVRINEVESNGGTPGDWIELYNPSASAIDLSGYILKDNDDTHNYALPAGTSIAAGGFYVAEEAQFVFGLGAPDAARLFSPSGTLIDSYSWDTHATTTYGRCPDGTGAFGTTAASTKGAANSCTSSTGVSSTPWPGGNNVQIVDDSAVFGGNLSGLAYEGANGTVPAVIWGARNGPGSLFRLVWNGRVWTPDTTSGWSAGKALHYPDGSGEPDAEGVTFTTGSAAGMYVSAERNNSDNANSRNSVLRYDPSGTGTALTATNEWNLTSDLPVTGANLGAEAISWIPDDFLVARGFYDEAAGKAYTPSDYANHGTGVFFVGLEANGVVYAYTLNSANNTFKRIATISTPFTGVMDLEFDRELNYLWATCDDGCGGQSAILEIDTTTGSSTKGRFKTTHLFARPSTMPNYNNEGFTVAPQSECVNGLKPAYWSDDSEDGGHALRKDSVPCAAFAAGASTKRP